MLGKAETMRDGGDVTIIACGIMVHVAMEAARALSDDGVQCRVVNMATLKPLDEDAVLDAARATGAIVTAEEHYILGGLTSQVSQVVARQLPVPVEPVALTGYAESGTPDELLLQVPPDGERRRRGGPESSQQESSLAPNASVSATLRAPLSAGPKVGRRRIGLKIGTLSVGLGNFCRLDPRRNAGASRRPRHGC